MPDRRPPKLATTILTHLGPPDDALAGDMREAYLTGKSGWWYWGQVLSAITAATILTARTHPVRTLRAAALGAACVWIGTRYIPNIPNFGQWMFETGVSRWFYLNGYGLPQWAREFPAMAAWKASAFGLSSYAMARTDIRSTIPFALTLALGNFIVFLQFSLGANSYSMTQLVADLIVLYPVAAFVGAFAGSHHIEVRC
jgi:hypothetical protein